MKRKAIYIVGKIKTQSIEDKKIGSGGGGIPDFGVGRS